MNKHLSQLIEIANLDKEIDSFEPRIKEAKKELSAIEEEEAKLRNEVEVKRVMLRIIQQRLLIINLKQLILQPIV